MPSVSFSKSMLSTWKWISFPPSRWGLYLPSPAAKLGDIFLYLLTKSFQDDSSCAWVKGVSQVGSSTSSLAACSNVLVMEMVLLPPRVRERGTDVGAGVGVGVGRDGVAD